MEYLMTYGWAILIIAVVLGVLFQLGVFSGSALTPKAAPGACQVVRLGGQMSLEGECQGQLPQYVGQFEGGSALINIPYSSSLGSVNTLTVAFWINQNAVSNINYENILYFGGASVLSAQAKFDSSNNEWMGFPGQVLGFTPIKPGEWGFMTGTDNGVYCSVFENGTLLPSTVFPCSTAYYTSGTSYIGGTSVFYGELSNVQLYNSSLSLNEIRALYLEGIGGAPIKIQNLVGWWPLNGNGNDYSGNNNNGQIAGNVLFNGTWQSGYTPP
jgi:hypothetical protein